MGTQHDAPGRITSLPRYIGHHRRPPGPPAEQEGVGAGCQGCPIQNPRPHLAPPQRRGGCQGEALQLRPGRQCQEPQGPRHPDRRGGVKPSSGGNERMMEEWSTERVSPTLGPSADEPTTERAVGVWCFLERKADDNTKRVPLVWSWWQLAFRSFSTASSFASPRIKVI